MPELSIFTILETTVDTIFADELAYSTDAKSVENILTVSYEQQHGMV